MAAAAVGQTGIAKELLSAGANVNARNNSGRTALSLAMKEGHAETANALRSAGGR